MVFQKKAKKQSLCVEGKEIVEQIEKIKKELELCRIQFNAATDENLIDGYIFEINALHKKYQYFLKKAKSCGLTAEGFEKIG